MGGGRFGPVYRARDAASGELVAVKVFDQGLTTERAASLADALDRLCRAPLDHPVIVPRLVAGTLADRAWVAEPWLDILPLDVVMRRDGAQPLGDALLRITQVAGALDFAAAAGIHHGALHPRDILLSADGTRLTGIGVLQALAEAGLDVPMSGAYVSPQRAAGESPTASDDIFALAAITYELVYGTPVPEHSELRASMPRLTGIHHGRFVDLLERALSPEAVDRPPTALALAGALQQVIVAGGAAPVSAAEPEEAESDSKVAPSTSRPEPDPIVRAVAVPPLEEDLPLRTTEMAWEADPEPPLQAPPAGTPELAFSDGVADREPEPMHAAGDAESTSGYWFPVAAALAIGIFAGFAGGFVVGQRDVTPAPLTAERVLARRDRPSSPDESPAPTAGREFTEADVPSTPRGSETPPQAVTEEQALMGGAARANEAPRAPNSEPGTQNPTREPEPGTRTGNPEAGTGNPEPGTGNPDPGTGNPRSAVLEVDSRPRGASVFVDGRLVGLTPLVLGDVEPGEHAVRIDLVGHRRWVTSVDVDAGARRRVAASLER